MFLKFLLDKTNKSCASLSGTLSEPVLVPPYRQRWANIYLHTFDSDLRFLPNTSPTSFTLFFQGTVEGQRLLPSIFCKVGVDGAMFFYIDSVKVDS
jgi:hypothetical protein